MGGESCGNDMKTIVEGSAYAVCNGTRTPAQEQSGGLYGCQSQCYLDGGSVATYLESAATKCSCQSECPCMTASEMGDGLGYLFVKESMARPLLCDSAMTCGAAKEVYKSSECC